MLLMAMILALSIATVHAADNLVGAERCLECHNNMPRSSSVHDKALTGSARHLLPGGDQEYRCEACHGPSGAHAQRQSGGDWQLPPATFRGRNEVAIGNNVCSGCHAETMKDLGAHAKSFHAAAERNELGCDRCHGGVAHGLPDLIIELSQKQEENKTR